MIRNVLGSVMGLVGATAAVWSPFRAWYDGRHGRDYRIEELFAGSGITADKANLAASILLPFVVAAVLTLLAVLRRSRFLMAAAGVIVLGFTVLWMVRQGQAAGSLSVGGEGTGLGVGVANAFFGGVLLLLAAVVMTGRGRRGRLSRSEPEPVPYAPVGAPVPPDRGGWADEPQGPTQTMPQPWPGHGPALGAPLDGPDEGPPPPPHGPPLGPPLNKP
ncbi:hypothetical protein ACWCQL_39250 [Streptomyces sp. NPDC002073]